MRRLHFRGWALAALVLAASASAAGPLVLVPPRTGGDVLAPVAVALRDAKGPEALSAAGLGPALKKLKLKPKDLANEARVKAVVREVGASGYLVAKPKGRGAGASVEVTLYDPRGRALWSGTEKLKRGKLPEDAARRIAQSVAGKLPDAEEAPKAAPPPDASAQAAAPRAPPEAPMDAPKPIESSAPVAAAPERKPAPAADAPKSASKPVTEPAQPVSRPEPATMAEGREPVVMAEPEKAARSDRSVAIPLVEVSAGAVALWRNQEFCPNVARCGDKTIDPVQPIRYTTDAPYFGPAVRVSAFPMARWSSPLRGLGVIGSYARGFLQTDVPAATGGQAVSLPTYDEDFSGELVYRLAFRLGIGEPSIGIRGGLQGRSFVLPANAVVTESRRAISPTVGAELALPLWDPHLRLEAAARYVPTPLPGSAERAAYGGDQVTARGLFASAGLTGQFDEGWGYVLMAELAAYTDTYTGQGERANGGAAHEEYYGVVGLLRYRF